MASNLAAHRDRQRRRLHEAVARAWNQATLAQQRDMTAALHLADTGELRIADAIRHVNELHRTQRAAA